MKPQPIHTTVQGRRFTTCPGCTAVLAALPLDAAGLECRHCGAVFDVCEAQPKKARKKKATT
jgi:hypothetical protein